MKKNIFVTLFTIVFIIITLVSCSSSNPADVTKRQEKSTTDTVTTTKKPLTDSTNKPPVTGGNTVSTTVPDAFEQQPVVSPSEKLEIDSALAGKGFLVIVSGDNKYSKEGLFTPDELDAKSAEDIALAGLIRIYGNKTDSNYKVKNIKVFMNIEAFSAFESMMATFKAVSGAGDVQVISAYDYTGDESLSSDAVTGLSVKLNVLSDKDSLTYPLNYGGNKVTVDGKEMTYLEWFEKNSAKFGFVYTGLTDDENNSLANFRYVGTVHSKYMVDNSCKLSDYVGAIKSGELSEITDANGGKWAVSYVKASETEKTELTVGEGAKYLVSGTGEGGFVLAIAKN